MQKTNKILVILTSQRDLQTSNPSHPDSADTPNTTGFDIKEAAYIYHEFVKNPKSSSMAVDFASPRGGTAPIDPMSCKASERDDIASQVMRDTEAMRHIHKETKKLADISPSDYTAILFVGGAGAIFDLPNNPQINTLVEHVIKNNNGIVAAIGHGIAALLNVRDPKQPGQPLLKNKRVTCNTIEEEKEMELDKALPFLVEKKLKEIGARFEKQEKFKSNVVVDERIITGQNRDSSRQWVETIAQNLQKM
jgi:putative intracellular protease/amidase